MLGSEPTTDPKVKRKLVQVLAAWHSQFKDDPSMAFVANLYSTVKPAGSARSPPLGGRTSEEDALEAAGMVMPETYEARRRREEKEEREEVGGSSSRGRETS